MRLLPNISWWRESRFSNDDFWTFLNTVHARVIYPSTAILEATTALQGKLNSRQQRMEQQLFPQIHMLKSLRLDTKIFKMLLNYFSPTGSKNIHYLTVLLRQ